jgi:hypothetical protein
MRKGVTGNRSHQECGRFSRIFHGQSASCFTLAREAVESASPDAGL